MNEKHEILAIIPARGGSKGIPKKNIRNFAGFPLIAYSITAGLRSKLVTRVIVSTDDEEISRVAKAYGAEVPFLRPAEYAQDETPDLPVFQHALKWLKMNEGYEPDIIVQLRPTSPIRPLNCVDDAIAQLISHPDADSIRGVVPAGQNPFKMWRIDPHSERMRPLLTVEGISEAYNAPRQALEPVYWQTGHIDAIQIRTIIEKGSMSGDVIYPLVIDPIFTVDIDTLPEWQQAEWLVVHECLEMVDPANQRRKIPDDVRLLVMDFDGVMTDNRVWVDEQGHERIAANRSDSLGLSLLRKGTKIQALVLSRETNPVVTARSEKLKLPVYQSVLDKEAVLREIAAKMRIRLDQIVYIGNDVNDLPCFPIVGFAVAPVDSQPEVLRSADLVLKNRGGHGAIRELCDILMTHEKKRSL